METWEAYRSRKNVREYADRAIPADVLDRILEAGRRAPSAMNRQPWDFIVVTDRDRLQRLAGVWRGAGHVAGSMATIVVTTPIESDPDRARWAEFDIGQAVMAMAIIAADAGVGSAHALAADQGLLASLLDMPATHRGAYVLALGYPASGPLVPLARMNRRSLEDVVHRERW
jgi:nitroreductase